MGIGQNISVETVVISLYETNAYIFISYSLI